MKKITCIVCCLLSIVLTALVQKSNAEDRYIKLACEYEGVTDIIDWRNIPTQYNRGIDYYIVDKVGKRILTDSGEAFDEFDENREGVVSDFNKEKNYIKFKFDGDIDNRPRHYSLYINGNTMEYSLIMRIASYGIIRKETFPSTNVQRKGYCKVVQMQQVKF